MLDTPFLSEAYADDGAVETDRIADLLHLTRLQLASAAGLSRDAVS
ncbi:MAG: hypothetical protein JWO26_3767 [Rhodospirillales bacterium]|nr:hypothetical protein [Rhodospirillales bacterium]